MTPLTKRPGRSRDLGPIKRKPLLAAAGVALFIAVSRAEEPDIPPLPLWHPSFTVTTGAGYKDNTTLRNEDPEESPFLKGGLEFFLMRLPLEGPEFQFTLSGDDVRYLSGDDIEKEQLLFSNANISKEFGSQWQASFGLELLYFDQVVDVSTVETNRVSEQVRGEHIRAKPGIRRGVADHGIIELTFPVARHWYSSPLDDDWEYGPNLGFIRPYGHESEWRVNFAYERRDYENRPQTDEDGIEQSGSNLSFNQHRIEFVSRHHFDEEKHWRATTKLGYKLNQDNGGGYFDYLRFQVSEQIRYRAKDWEISAEARVGFYEYVKQRVSDDDDSERERGEVLVILRVERQLARWLRAFAEYEFEQVLANDDIEEYSVNVVTAGLMWEF